MNPKQRYGDAKPQLQLCPPAALRFIAAGLSEGVPKYGAWNWRDNRVTAMTYVGATMRHLGDWVDGEEIDPESANAKHHLAGAIASLAILIDAMENGFLQDDRPPAVA